MITDSITYYVCDKCGKKTHLPIINGKRHTWGCSDANWPGTFRPEGPKKAKAKKGCVR